jgi:riboflavin kinase/FMN adenylyltransferase
MDNVNDGVFNMNFVCHGVGDILPSHQGGTVVIGNFDGVHLGHEKILQTARTLNMPPLILLSFEPHPREFFTPDIAPFRLSSQRQKIEYLRKAGADGMVILPFDAALSQMDAKDFVKNILTDALHARHVVLGHDFRFGKNREGDGETILKNSDIGVSSIAAFKGKDEGGDVISSSAIRLAIQNGYMDKAAKMLGRPYAIIGKVEMGDRLGRELGFPTANISLGQYLRPLRGVYGCKISLENGRVYTGVCNYGVRPSVDGVSERLEAHIFDFDGDIYGQDISCEFLTFIRAEMHFSSLEDLKKQIEEDCNKVRAFFLNEMGEKN